jgi:uncharacterized protein
MKASRYNLLVETFAPGQWIAFNGLTGTYLALDETEARQVARWLAAPEVDAALPPDVGLAQPSDPVDVGAVHAEVPADTTDGTLRRQLTAGGFLVGNDVDELALIRRRYHEGREASRGLSLTVAPTVACNFRCSYCFQEHPNRRMSDEDVAALQAFVLERLQPDTHLNVTWFGGEPLLAAERLLELARWCRQLADERNCGFSHSMVSNGYLLTESLAEQLAAIGGFSDAQITLDGTRELHDTRRPLAGGRGTFDTILDNVAKAAAHITIALRVNVDRSNVAQLEELLDELADRGLKGSVGVYLGHVWEYTEQVEGLGGTGLSVEEFARLQVAFELLKLQKGFGANLTLPRPRTGSVCVADNADGYVLSPGGLVFNCWNEAAASAAQASGRYDRAPHAAADGLLQQNASSWAGYDASAQPACADCAVLPLCLSGCPWEARKAAPGGTGQCSPLRYNLDDRLRLHHLNQALVTARELAASGSVVPAPATATPMPAVAR